VPLILIPQILFSGFVVPLAEMTWPMRALSDLIPSGAAQRMVDLSWVSGRNVPLMVDRSVRPLLWWTLYREDKPEKQDVDPVTGEAVEERSARPRPRIPANDLDEFNTAWANIGYTSPGDGGVREQNNEFEVRSREDLKALGTAGQRFTGAGRVKYPVLVLVFWSIGGYLIVWTGLCFSQPQAYAPEWAKKYAGSRRD
jgi:hypothetical protein